MNGFRGVACLAVAAATGSSVPDGSLPPIIPAAGCLPGELTAASERIL